MTTWLITAKLLFFSKNYNASAKMEEATTRLHPVKPDCAGQARQPQSIDN